MPNPFKARAHQRDAQRALLQALEPYQAEGVQEALKHGAQLRGFSDKGVPMLHLLVQGKGMPEGMIRQAVTAGAGLEDRPRDDTLGFAFTPLLLAAWMGTPEQVRLLLELGASIKAISGQDRAAIPGTMTCRWHGSSAAHLAAQRPDSEALHVLVNAGARVDVYDRLGRLPLHAALSSARRGRIYEEVSTVQRLLEAGADPNAPVRGKRREATQVGDRPLHLAVDMGRADDVQALLSAGADPLVRDAQGLTLLERAQRSARASPGLIVLLEGQELRRLATTTSDDRSAPRRRL